MNRSYFAALGLLALAGCGGGGGGGEDGYPMTVGEARERLVNGAYEKGMVDGFSSHNLTVKAVSDTDLEWHILSDGGNGIWCTAKLTPAGDQGTRTRVVNTCETQFVGKEAQASLDRIVEATLTGTPYIKQ